MSAVFDTLTYARQLQQAGVSPEQAEVHAYALQGVVQGYIGARFVHVDQRFDQIEQHFKEIDPRFAQLEQRLDQLDRKVDRLEGKMEAGVVRLDGRIEALAERHRGQFLLLRWMLAAVLAALVAGGWVLYRLALAGGAL